MEGSIRFWLLSEDISTMLKPADVNNRPDNVGSSESQHKLQFTENHEWLILTVEKWPR